VFGGFLKETKEEIWETMREGNKESKKERKKEKANIILYGLLGARRLEVHGQEA